MSNRKLAQQSDDPFAGEIKGEAKIYDLAENVDELKAAGLEIKGDAQMESTPDGLKITARKNSNKEKWPTVSAAVSSKKDFDVSVDVADVKITNAKKWGSNLGLQVSFDNVEKSSISVGLRRDKNKNWFVQANEEYDQPDGKRRKDSTKLFEPFENGTLRLVRRGGKVYALAAAEGKPHQVISSFIVGDKAVENFSVIAKSATDKSKLDAVVKRLSVNLQP